MKNNIARARDMMPSIIITVLSMIQALAMELYWSSIQGSEFLWLGGRDAVIGWLQMAVMLLGILQIWLMYVSLMLRFSWLPSMRDTVIPFGIGLLEFSLIDMLGPDKLGPWFALLAVIFSLSIWSAHTFHQQARKDPQNSYFFEGVAPASWRDYLVSILGIILLVLFSAALWMSGNRGALAVIALLYAAAALIYQLALSHRYWMHSLVEGEEEAA